MATAKKTTTRKKPAGKPAVSRSRKKAVVAENPTLHGLLATLNFNGSFVRTFLFVLLVLPLVLVAATVGPSTGFDPGHALLVGVFIVALFMIYEIAFTLLVRYRPLPYKYDSVTLLISEGVATAGLYLSFLIVPSIGYQLTNVWLLTGAFLVAVLGVRFCFDLASRRR